MGDRLRSHSGAAGFFAFLILGGGGAQQWSAAPGAVRRRPYRYEYTGSLSNSEVNRSRALSVGEWGTVSEAIRVLPAFCFFRRRAVIGAGLIVLRAQKLVHIRYSLVG